MFLQMFIYKTKELGRKYWLIGWNFLFPIVLSTAFFLGFGNLIKDDPDTFKTLNVGYVCEIQNSNGFEQVLKELSTDKEAETKVLKYKAFSSEDKAKKAMNNNKIDGYYIEKGNKIETIIPSNGLSSTIMTEVVRSYDNYTAVIHQVAKDHPEKLEEAIHTITSKHNFVKEHSFGADTSHYIQYFYALLAMTSLFSSWIGTKMLDSICANLSECGKRVECAPGSKLLKISAGFLSGILLQSVSNLIIVTYIQEVLHINLGMPLQSVLLICTIGSGVGMATGTLMGSIIKDENLLVAVPLFFTMVCSFFSGLMWGEIKQIIQYNMPIINKLNPAALLTDAMYIRATYGATADYKEDILIMSIMIIICLLVSAFFLRRRKYVSL